VQFIHGKPRSFQEIQENEIGISRASVKDGLHKAAFGRNQTGEREAVKPLDFALDKRWIVNQRQDTFDLRTKINNVRFSKYL